MKLFLSLDMLLPMHPREKGGINHQGLRLFACDCAERVIPLLTDPFVREALYVGRRYARGEASWEVLELSFTIADSVKVPSRYRQPHHWAMIAATACCLTECSAGPMNQGRSPEWAGIGAARIASCAARLAEQGAWFRTSDEVEDAQIDVLRHYVPECFTEET